MCNPLLVHNQNVIVSCTRNSGLCTQWHTARCSYAATLTLTPDVDFTQIPASQRPRKLPRSDSQTLQDQSPWIRMQCPAMQHRQPRSRLVLPTLLAQPTPMLAALVRSATTFDLWHT